MSRSSNSRLRGRVRNRFRARFLAVLVGLSVVLLIWPEPLSGTLRSLMQVVVPMQHTMRAIAAQSAPDEPLDAEAASRLRAELRARSNQAGQLAVRVRTLEEEVAVLRDLRAKDIQGVLIPAVVVAYDSMPYRDSVLIDRGGLIGVLKDHPVISSVLDIETPHHEDLQPELSVLDGEVLVGEISEVAPYTARVLLATDPESRLRLIRVIHHGGEGPEVRDAELMLYGAGNGLMEIRDIDYHLVDGGEIAVGDEVRTAAGDALLRSSVLVGDISALRRDDDNPALYIAVVQPAFKLAGLQRVYIVNPRGPNEAGG